jgi:superfamily II DNA or RNA helicase
MQTALTLFATHVNTISYPMRLRPYQQRAVDQVRSAWATAKRVCLVMPTGGGKTIAAWAATVGMDALWLVHRRELAEQAPGRAVTIQALLASGERPAADVLIADECHHLAPAAHEWHAIAASYPRILGLTATPQRGDGSPLGDLFEHLVVGASYSELLADGHLVDAQVYRPAEVLQGYATDPAKAWLAHAEGRRGFAYFARAETARAFSGRLGSTCKTITGTTPHAERDASIARFRAGGLSCLSNVQCLTEGVDVPEASVCMIARGCRHQGAYLQMVGRVLRPAPGKTHAVVIDLGGVSHIHGLPCEDREYSLDGRAIRAKLEPLRVCPECGRTQPAARDHCEGCGFVFPVAPPRPARVWDVPLELARAAAATDKERGIVRWREKMATMDEGSRRTEYHRLQALGASKNYKPGWAKYQYKLRFGTWPRG